MKLEFKGTPCLYHGSLTERHGDYFAYGPYGPADRYTLIPENESFRSPRLNFVGRDSFTVNEEDSE